MAADVGPLAAGLWQDDAIYLCTAKSLAAGTGYRHIELPAQPLQTKYPILYSAVLATLFVVNPRYPNNLFLLLMPTALAAAALVVLSVVYWHRVLAAPRRHAILLGLLAVLSPAIFSLLRFTMSDLFYSFLSVAALVLLDLKYSQAETEKRRVFCLIASALAVALSMLTRSIGISLAAAALLGLLIKRRFRDAALMLLIVVLCVSPWLIWQRSAARANGPVQSSTLEAPELSYSLWLPRDVGQTARVIRQNIFRAIFGFGYYQIALPAQFAMEGTANFSWQTICLYLACYGLAILILIGFWLSRNLRQEMQSEDVKKSQLGEEFPLPGGRGSAIHDNSRAATSNDQCWHTVHIYGITYFFLMLVWPFDPARFLVPWAPFLLYFMFSGLRAVPRLTSYGIWILYAVLMVLFLSDDIKIISSTADNYYIRETWTDCSEIRDLERWLAANTTREDVIASDRPAGLFLACERKGQYFWPDTDPYALYYGEDREWWSFYSWPGNQENQSVYEQMNQSLATTYARANMAYCVEHTGSNAQAVALARIIAENPDWFELQHTTPKGTHKVYRVHIPKN